MACLANGCDWLSHSCFGRAARGSWDIAVSAALLPLEAIGAISRAFVGGGRAPAPDVAAQQAARQAVAQRQESDRQAESIDVASCLRLSAIALAKHQEPTREHLARLAEFNPSLVDYIRALSPDELHGIASSSLRKIRCFMQTGIVPGMPDLAEVLRRAAAKSGGLQRVHDASADGERRSLIRAAVRASMRGRQLEHGDHIDAEARAILRR